MKLQKFKHVTVSEVGTVSIIHKQIFVLKSHALSGSDFTSIGCNRQMLGHPELDVSEDIRRIFSSKEQCVARNHSHMMGCVCKFHRKPQSD